MKKGARSTEKHKVSTCFKSTKLWVRLSRQKVSQRRFIVKCHPDSSLSSLDPLSVNHLDLRANALHESITRRKVKATRHPWVSPFQTGNLSSSQATKNCGKKKIFTLIFHFHHDCISSPSECETTLMHTGGEKNAGMKISPNKLLFCLFAFLLFVFTLFFQTFLTHSAWLVIETFCNTHFPETKAAKNNTKKLIGNPEVIV